MNEPEMTNNELKIWLAGEFRALRTEMNSEFNLVREEMNREFNLVRQEIKTLRTEMNGEIKLVREEIKTLQTEVRGEIGRIDARIDGQNTLVTGLLFPFAIAIAIPLGVFLWKKARNATNPKSGDVIENDDNQTELELGSRPKHQSQRKPAEPIIHH